jgi:flagellar hook assembly protein FlgD
MPPFPVTLYQNHPNPFNPQTVIRFYLPEAQEIFLDVYDVAGERVARLAEGKREKGFHEERWDGRNGSGVMCSSGVYFSRLKAGKSTISCKMVIMR